MTTVELQSKEHATLQESNSTIVVASLVINSVQLHKYFNNIRNKD